TPQKIEKSLSKDQFKLYKLIWERFVACQMANCVLNTNQATISANDYIFKASGFTVHFDGFTALYEESKDVADEKSKDLPNLEEGMPLKVKELFGNQHFTQAPPRFTEASLIKTLEENGIGRPSTYAATISTITSREYVAREGKSFRPTELGEVTTNLIKEKFSDIVNVKFTAGMENRLDKVESGDEDWVQILHSFYDDFAEEVKKAKVEMAGVKIELEEDKTDLVCDKCGKKMVVKHGRFGKFIACSGYPDCKNIMKIVKDTGALCPKCGGKIIEKKTKKNRAFYGCNNYPECNFVSWDAPSTQVCPFCGKYLMQKKGKKQELYCLTEDCKYKYSGE
ncbi:MAG: DNA topoisomerase, partial [Clostridia bacterium]